jgi:hypothetical protein
MIGRLGMPELVIILFICLITLVPLAIGVWLVLRLVRGRSAKEQALEARIEALERGARQP